MIHVGRSRHNPEVLPHKHLYPLETITQRLRINILTTNVCGLKSKLLLEKFILLVKNYDVVCMCETRCDNAYVNNIRKVMESCGVDIVYKDRSALSRYKSGLLIAV